MGPHRAARRRLGFPAQPRAHHRHRLHRRRRDPTQDGRTTPRARLRRRRRPHLDRNGRRFPDAVAAFRTDPVANHLPDGEDPVKAADRFTACLHDIAQQHPDGRVLVVSHTTAIRLALCRLIGVPLSAYRRLFPFVRNCGLTELRLTDGQTAVLEFNTPIEPEGFRATGSPIGIAGRPS